MKKLILLLLVVAFAITSSDASAQGASGGFSLRKLANTAGPTAITNPVIKDGYLVWNKKSTTTLADSTSVGIIVWGGGVTVAAATDTTKWLSVGSYKFPAAVGANFPLVQFVLGHQAGAATDSIGYIVQYSADGGTTFTSTATQHVPTSGSGATATSITVLDSDDPVANAVRLIVLNNKIASGVTRRYSIVPIIRTVN